jgi:hypothetical protein
MDGGKLLGDVMGSQLIAWWGAGLSSFLAVVKLWELWRDRFQTDVGKLLLGQPVLLLIHADVVCQRLSEL